MTTITSNSARNRNGPGPEVRRTGRMGLVKYAEILIHIAKKPRSADEVAEAMRRNNAQSVREVLWKFRSTGLAYVCEWRSRESKKAVMQPVFAVGPGVSVPYPTNTNRRFGDLKDIRPEVISFSTLINALREGATRAELNEQTGIAHHRIAPVIRILKENNLVYVKEWELRKGCPAEVLAFGNGRDAARKKPLTDRERKARYDSKMRAKRRMIYIIRSLAGIRSEVGSSA